MLKHRIEIGTLMDKMIENAEEVPDGWDNLSDNKKVEVYAGDIDESPLKVKRYWLTVSAWKDAGTIGTYAHDGRRVEWTCYELLTKYSNADRMMQDWLATLSEGERPTADSLRGWIGEPESPSGRTEKLIALIAGYCNAFERGNVDVTPEQTDRVRGVANRLHRTVK